MCAADQFNNLNVHHKQRQKQCDINFYWIYLRSQSLTNNLSSMLFICYRLSHTYTLSFFNCIVNPDVVLVDLKNAVYKCI